MKTKVPGVVCFYLASTLGIRGRLSSIRLLTACKAKMAMGWQAIFCWWTLLPSMVMRASKRSAEADPFVPHECGTSVGE
jgi:hypothetical protein